MKTTVLSRSRALTLVLTVTASTALMSPATVAGARPAPEPEMARTLNLGAADLPETRSVTQLAPGVTHTSIARGTPNAALFWTAEVTIPSADPAKAASALADEATARDVAARLRDHGISARVEHVVSPRLADAGGDLGYRVRAGQFATQAEGTDTQARIKAAGFASALWYTGWDGDAASVDQSRGPWNLEVLTIDPGAFDGSLAATFGADLEKRETTSELSAAAGAGVLAAVNAGFFVFDPRAGAEGDPAGAGVYSGKVLSEAVGDRPALVIDGKKARADVERLTWSGAVADRSAELTLDGINRVPGLIRNCGGTPDDVVTSEPLHDVTCTDPDEIVSFTPEFGTVTPSGAGLEVVLDAKGVVTAVNRIRGTAVPAGGGTVQAIGADVERLAALAQPGEKLTVTSELAGDDGSTLGIRKNTQVVNGGPLLLEDGKLNVTAGRDGMVHTDNPGMFYGWVHKRNPRTIAGIDAAGRLVLVTADGRQTDSLGLSIQETAQVAQSLGMVEAINLDGGGSTTMVVDGTVVNTPSNIAGSERAVGDALVVLPSRR